jgi:hypothetical protein
MTEGIGKVSRFHASPKEVAHPLPFEIVPNVRLSTNEDFVGEYIPRPDEKVAGLHQSFETFTVLRLDLEVILQDNRLPVEHERSVR